MVENTWQTVQGPIAELYDQKAEETPDQVENVTRDKRRFISEVLTQVDALNLLIADKMPEEVRTDHDTVPRVQQVYKDYQREALPEFKGGITEYAAFKKEWKERVAPGREEAWQLIQLQKRTPEECNLSFV